MSKSEYQLSVILKIKKERETRGLGQKNISDMLGLSLGQIGNIESPKYPHKYTLRQLNVLCKHFRIPIEQLFIPNDTYMDEDANIISLLIDKIIEYED